MSISPPDSHPSSTRTHAPPVDMASFLVERRTIVLGAANEEISRAHLQHYDRVGASVTADRLATLLDLLVSCCRDHQLGAARDYADSLAAERTGNGYPLNEVQTAANVVEEAVWATITSDLPAEVHGYALGLVSTILGAVKDRLACAYVATVSSEPVRTLNLEYLFSGSDAAAGSA